MRYPAFIRKGATVGLIAPSFGISGYPYDNLYNSAVAQLKTRGYAVKACASVHGFSHAASAPADVRGREMMAMMTDPAVDALISVAGGELMCQMIPYVDFAALKKAEPKWFLGFSDNTFMTFLLNTLADTASLYGCCFSSFGMVPWDKAVEQCWQILNGRRLTQRSYDLYQIEDLKHKKGHALKGYNKTEPVVVKDLSPEKTVTVSGRLTGGCLDVLQLIAGTRFDKVRAFNKKYGSEGILWFFEPCNLTVMGICTALWQLKQAGWLDRASGIIIGRPVHPETIFDVDLKEAYQTSLADLNVPVIYDLDFGHLPPAWTLISGSRATVVKKGDRAQIAYELK